MKPVNDDTHIFAAPERIDQGIRASQARLQAILDSAIDYAIITTDRTGTITGWNQGARTILGWEEAEVLGEDASLFYTPEDIQAGVPETEGRTAVRGGIASDDRWHLRKGGSRFWASGSVTPLYDEADDLVGFVKILRDHTQQHLADEALRKSEAFNRIILASSSDCIDVLDLEGHLQFMNEGGQRSMEIENFAVFAGGFWPQLWEGQGVADSKAAIAAAKAGGTGRFQGFSPTVKGTIKLWDAVVTPVLDSDGKPEKLLAVSRDITALHEAQQALARSEAQLRTIHNTVPVGLLMAELPSGRIVGGNKYLETILRHPIRYTKNLDRHDEWVSYHPDGRRVSSQEYPIARIQCGEEAPELEVLYQRGDETRAWVRILGRPIHDESGTVTGAVVAMVDTDKEKRAEEALRDSRDRLTRRSHALATLNRLGVQLVAELDLEILVQRVVDAGVELTGAQFGAFFYNVQSETSEHLMLYALSGAERADFEKFGMPRATDIFAPTFRGEGIIRSDDITMDERYGRNSPHNGMPTGHLPVRSYLSVPVASRSGEIIGGLFFGHPGPGVFGPGTESVMTGLASQAAIAIDNARLFQEAQRANEVLEQRVKERAQELVASEARSHAFFITSSDARAVIRETPDGFTVVDMNPAALEIINPAALEFAGRRREEAIGTHFARDYSSLLTPNLGQRLQECLASDQPVYYEETRSLPTGKRIFETSLVAIEDPSTAGQGRLILLNSRDVTENRKTAEQLRQAQKMEAVGQLTGGLAHDFNNLLTGIIGSLEVVQARIAQGRMADLARFAGAAMTSANRAAALTHRLLAFSRRQTLDPKPTNVNKLTTGMAELIQRTVGPAVRVETAMSGDLWMTLCDPNQLENVLLNLAINARDAMPDGGHLTIEAANTRLDDVCAAQQLDVAPGQYVAISVMDTGSGMTSEVIARAFEPFFTTKPLGEGTGLGLSMTYGFARQSGGHVQIDSEIGRGTRVRLYLPRHAGQAEVDFAPPAPAELLPAHTGKTVLVVDDEPVVRMLVADVLSELGCTVLEAGDGPGGLCVLQSMARIDLLITDVGLPNGMNGRQLADAARVLRRDLRVLFITGYAENAVMSNGYFEPGMQVMTKPFAMDTLAARIRGMIETPPSMASI